ncbi:MAG: pantoate--beta-alanine ligase [Rhodomicrobium sp.]|nr:pantoate--beta-alanine ligase [Rhodomicrobium sp.]
MTTRLPVLRFTHQLRQTVQQWRRRGHKIALVPTMGGLHEGHLSLVRLAKKHAGRVVVSVFVNPTQFAPHEDYGNYPRNEERDWHKLQSVQADAMYAPDVHEIYPEDFATRVEVAGITQTLEGISRPHFFSGVTTVVTKLFLQCLPDIAIFSEKDYQQLLVIKRLVKDLNFPLNIVSAPIKREPDGLAMSSRNVYLNISERAVAPQLFAVLSDMGADLAAGRAIEDTVRQGKSRLENTGFRIDYLEVRDAETLMPVETAVTAPARVLAAVHLGRTRLIDNVPFIPPAGS